MTFAAVYAIVNLVKRVLLCSNSIPLAGLAASLRRHSELTVIHATLADLCDLPGPDDVVIVDAAQTTEALTLLQPHPAWRLLSVDAAAGVLTAYAAQSQQVHEIEGIARYLKEVDK